MESYYDRSRRERIMLDELYKVIYKNNYDIKYYHTPIDSYDTYDSVVNRFCKDTYLLNDTHIYEAKVRYEDYPDILLEKKKYNSLKKEAKRWNNGYPVSIYYVSCHPSGTYIFNLDKLENIQWIKEAHNVSTTEMYKGKENKMITYLPISIAKFVNIKSTDLEALELIKTTEDSIEKIIVGQQQNKKLYGFII